MFESHGITRLTPVVSCGPILLKNCISTCHEVIIIIPILIGKNIADKNLQACFIDYISKELNSFKLE